MSASDKNVINLLMIVQLSLYCNLVSTLRVQFLVKMKILKSESHGYKFDLFVSKKLLEMLKSTSSIIDESNYTNIFNPALVP